MNIEQAKHAICEWSKKMTRDGIVSGNYGFLSHRVGNSMVITPKGVDLETCTPRDLVVVSLDDLSANKKDSSFSEQILHANIYKKKKQFQVLVHSHSLNIMTASKAGKTVYPMLDDVPQLVGASIKVAPYSSAMDKKDIKQVIKALNRRSGVLISNNGAICGAVNFDDAYAIAKVTDKGCQAVIETSFLGGGIKINWVEAHLMRLIYTLSYSKADAKNR